ncbi:adhesion G-protein coupled receptor G4 [Lithobates pipiens]
MKMKGTSQFLLKLFLLLILTPNLVTSADKKLLPNEKAPIVSIRNIGQLQDTNIPPLIDFTVCLDLNCTNKAAWTVFSYCVEDGEQPAELGLGFLAKGSFQIFHLGVHYEFELDLKIETWYTICLTRNSITGKLEAYVNGEHVFHIKSSNDPVKGGGSLVLGCNHSRKAGNISLIKYTNFIGELYNFQMWNYSRSPNEMYDCSEGNLLSWTKELWNFNTTIDEKLRCALPPSTSTTPLDPNLSSTETLNAATTSTSKLTTAPELYSTTKMGTTSILVKPPESQATDQAGLSDSSTQFSTAESFSENNPVVNPSIILPTRNNVSTTGNISSSHPIHPAATTTPTVTTSPLLKHTTVQQLTTSSTLATTPPYVTANSGSLPVTTTDSSGRSSAAKPSPPSSITALPPSTSTTPLDPNLSSTETLNAATTSTSKLTTAPELYFTTKMGTTSISAKPPESQATDQPGLSDSSTQFSTAESFSENNPVVNSSIILPTRNNVSTTGNISSSHPIHPAATTTTTSTTSPLLKHTTVQQLTTSSTLATTPPYVTTNSGSIPVTTTDSSGRSSAAKPSPPSITDTQVGITNITETSLTDSTTSKDTRSPPAILTSTKTPASSTSSDFKRTTQANTSFSTLSPALSGMTESLVSESIFTSTATSENSKKPGQAITVSYFVVSLSLKFSDVVIDADEVASFVKSMMDSYFNNTDFSVLEITVSEGPSYISKLIIQANSSGAPESLATNLKNLLEDLKDEQGNIHFSIQSVSITALEKCPAEKKQYNNFIYDWEETNPAGTAQIQCYTNTDEFVLRYCSISVITEMAEWKDPDFSRCVLLTSLPNSFEDLDNITVTPENAKYLAEHILNMTTKAHSLPENYIRVILSKVSEIIALADTDITFATIHLNVINDILTKASSLYKFTNRILNITEEIGFKMNFPGDSANVTSDSMALLVSNVNFSSFQDHYFTVTSYQQAQNIEIISEKPPIDNVVVSIYLPEAIGEEAGLEASKLQFTFLGSLSLFLDYTFGNYKLNTYVISATVEGVTIQKLDQPVRIKLQHIVDNTEMRPVKCVFWDITKNDNIGGWNESGCSVDSTDVDFTSCNCSHLTHFGVLLDFSRKPINPFDEYIMSLMTYVGCGITSLFLGLTLVTYGMFKQLRRDYPSKILMNLSFSMLMLNLIFLVDDWLTTFRIHGLCVTVAAFLHYFLLTSFTWMGLEAVHMYFAFVKVFNSYIHKYILKLCIAGWGIPAVIVVAVLSINVDFYGAISKNNQYSDPSGDSESFCWIQNNVVFYVTVATYFCIIFLTNISMFIVVLIQIKSLKSTKRKDWKALFFHDIKSTLSLVFLLGITWGFAFFAWDPVRIAFMYLFAIFNTLQGFFIFVFHCLIKENVRKHWRMYLCCGRCQLDNYSDWSRLSNADTKYNGRIHQSPSDSYQSTRSNNTASTNSSSLSGFSRDGYSGWTYRNGGGIFINSAHAAPSNCATTYPDSRRTLPFLDFGT